MRSIIVQSVYLRMFYYRILKGRLREASLSSKLVKECLIGLIYIEMLGHDASFAYVNVVQLTASGDIMQKRVGYLAAGLMLSPDHEFRVMLVNQLQRDLSSSNILEISTALMAISKLLTNEMKPALIPSIRELLNHEHSSVRKKAIFALFSAYQLDPSSTFENMSEIGQRSLCDKSPEVMGASLTLLHALAKADPARHRYMVPSYIIILKQIFHTFDYYK